MTDQTIWSKANSVIVFYSYKDQVEFERFRKSFDSIIKKNALMNSYFVVFVDVNVSKSILPINSYFIYLSKKDINLFGKLKNKADANKIEKKFDLMLVYGEINDKFLRIIRKTKAGRRVGGNTTDKISLDIKLHSNSEGIEQITNFTREILEKIKV